MGKPTLIGLEGLLKLAAESDNVPSTPSEFTQIKREQINDVIPHTLSLCSKYATGEWLNTNTLRAMRRRLVESDLPLDRLQYAGYLVHVVTMRAYEKCQDRPTDKRLTTH